jgi:hypothetical protein
MEKDHIIKQIKYHKSNNHISDYERNKIIDILLKNNISEQDIPDIVSEYDYLKLHSNRFLGQGEALYEAIKNKSKKLLVLESWCFECCFSSENLSDCGD